MQLEFLLIFVVALIVDCHGAASSSSSSSSASLYSVLGIQASANSSNVNSGFRRFWSLFQPAGHLDVSTAKVYELRLSQVVNAYDVLSNPIARRRYDEGKILDETQLKISKTTTNELVQWIEQEMTDSTTITRSAKGLITAYLYPTGSGLSRVLGLELNRLSALLEPESVWVRMVNCEEQLKLCSGMNGHPQLQVQGNGWRETIPVRKNVNHRTLYGEIKDLLTVRDQNLVIALSTEEYYRVTENREKIWIIGVVYRDEEEGDMVMKTLVTLAATLKNSIQIASINCNVHPCEDDFQGGRRSKLVIYPCGGDEVDRHVMWYTEDVQPMAFAMEVMGVGIKVALESQCAKTNVKPKKKAPPIPAPVIPKKVLSAEEINKLVEGSWTLFRNGQYAECEKKAKSVVDHAENEMGYFVLGLCLEHQGKTGPAYDAYTSAIAKDGQHVLAALNNAGNIAKQSFRNFTLAEQLFQKCIQKVESLGATFFYPFKNLGSLYEKNGRTVEAIAYHEKSLRHKRDDGHMIYTKLLLPYQYNTIEEMNEWRQKFIDNIDVLSKMDLKVEQPGMMEGVPQYYFAYYGSKAAPHFEKLGKMFEKSAPGVKYTCDHVRRWVSPQSRKIRVGFASYYLRAHSVTKMIGGLLKNLDKTKIEIILISWGDHDNYSEILKSHASRYLRIPRGKLQDMQRSVCNEQLDIMIFPEIGMDPNAYALSYGRLAPVQLAMHGHADTTGSTGIDYYVSYDGFHEGSYREASSHYTETLLRLPGLTPLPLWYSMYPFKAEYKHTTPEGRRAMRTRFSIPVSANVYSCAQTLFKLTPHLDSTFQQILQQDPAAVLVFKELPMTDQVGKFFLDRLRNKFSAEELSRVKILPPLSDTDYQNMFAMVDVSIDSYPFGGHTTTMDALSNGIPVVSLPSKLSLMSGTCTLGFLKLMGLERELVARDESHLAQLAVGLGTNEKYRLEISNIIKSKFNDLINDNRSVMAWNDLLQDLALGRNLDRYKQ